MYRSQKTAVVFIMSWRPVLHGRSSCLCLSDVSSYSVQMPRAGNCQHEDQKTNLSSIIKQACPYQDSNKSRIGTIISATLHLMIRSFSKVLGNAKLTVLTQALVGLPSSALSLPFCFSMSADLIQLSKSSKLGVRIRSKGSCSPVRTETRTSLASVQNSNHSSIFHHALSRQLRRAI